MRDDAGMIVHEMAQLALAILWGGALCGLGLLAVTLLASKEGDQTAPAFAVLMFTVALLATLETAGVTHVVDWFGQRFG
jgi:hypothetical protein